VSVALHREFCLRWCVLSHPPRHLTVSVKGIPMIEHAQKRKVSGLLNTATVATFFSGVSATALQYSVASHATVSQQLVDFSWTVALVFSLTRAINIQIATVGRWRHAAAQIFLSRSGSVSGLRISDAPLLFFIASAVLFALDLVCFSSPHSEAHLSLL